MKKQQPMIRCIIRCENLPEDAELELGYWFHTVPRVGEDIIVGWGSRGDNFLMAVKRVIHRVGVEQHRQTEAHGVTIYAEFIRME